MVKRLLENGLLEESSERPDPALDDERRRYYRLTEFGRAVAVAESRRLEATLGIARAKRLIPVPGSGRSRHARDRSLAKRVFRWIARLLPFDFRRDYGQEMERAFADDLDEPARRQRRSRTWTTFARAVAGIGPSRFASMRRSQGRTSLTRCACSQRSAASRSRRCCRWRSVLARRPPHSAWWTCCFSTRCPSPPRIAGRAVHSRFAEHRLQPLLVSELPRLPAQRAGVRGPDRVHLYAGERVHWRRAAAGPRQHRRRQLLQRPWHRRGAWARAEPV